MTTLFEHETNVGMRDRVPSLNPTTIYYASYAWAIIIMVQRVNGQTRAYLRQAIVYTHAIGAHV